MVRLGIVVRYARLIGRALVIVFGLCCGAAPGLAWAQAIDNGLWQQADVGDVGLAGSATESSDGDLIITGAGSDIWGTADSFHFVYQRIEDGSITSNQPSLQNTDPFAKIGLMIRLSLDPGSPEVIIDVKPDGTVEFMTRSMQGGETTYIAGLGSSGGLSLVRSNGIVTGSVCRSGSCVTVGSTPFPTGPALVGAAITSHNPSVLNTGGFPASPPRVNSVPSPWSTGDVGTVGLRGSALYQEGTFTVSGAGADIWGTSDAYRMVGAPLAADGTVAARVVSESATNIFAKAGVIANSNGASGPTVILDIRPDGNIEFMSRTAQGGSMAFVAGASASFPMWLELARSGDTFTGYMSSDGATWQMVGTTDVSMPNQVWSGLAVTSHDTSVLNTAIFDNAAVSSAGPIDADIGDVGAAGSATASGTTAVVSGSGSDIWGTQDSFNFEYRHVVNDGGFYARIDSLDNTSPYAKAGIMIRASTDPSAAHVIVDVKPDGGIEFMTRAANGAETTYLAGTVRAFPVSLGLARSGTTVTGYVIDGTQMTAIGSVSIDLPADSLIGLAVTSHERGTLTTATFDSVGW